jgi:hypothetical protein
MRHARSNALRHRYGRAFGQKAAVTSPEFEAALASFISSAQHSIDEHNARFFADARVRTGDATFGGKKLSIERGPRYIRVVVADVSGVSRSVYCFIDATNGDILKSASWKTPAKHARGSIFAANPLDAVTVYGGRYLR